MEIEPQAVAFTGRHCAFALINLYITYYNAVFRLKLEIKYIKGTLFPTFCPIIMYIYEYALLPEPEHFIPPSRNQTCNQRFYNQNYLPYFLYKKKLYRNIHFNS